MKSVARWIARTISSLIILVLLIDGWFDWSQSPAIRSIQSLDSNHDSVALVLGTSKYLVGGGINRYYQARIDTAAELYHLGKVRVLLVSGDNGTLAYNEPVQMQRDLIRLGVPESAIVLDYAGFRTLDSVQRAQQVFGLDHMIIISQPFHLPRALYLAEQADIHAYGVAARQPNIWYNAKVRLREVGARNKALLDTLLGKRAKFLGPAEPIALPKV